MAPEVRHQKTMGSSLTQDDFSAEQQTEAPSPAGLLHVQFGVDMTWVGRQQCEVLTLRVEKTGEKEKMLYQSLLLG
ncbi:hypothetical protein INR49_024512 [Caranx melampygus]|nr:hypothetical protein INR49_024512 [Caranx melampygus]